MKSKYLDTSFKPLRTSQRFEEQKSKNLFTNINTNLLKSPHLTIQALYHLAIDVLDICYQQESSKEIIRLFINGIARMRSECI